MAQFILGICNKIIIKILGCFSGVTPAPWPKKKERDRKRARQTKVVGIELEGFVDWTGILASEHVEEEEMSMLAVGFAAWMQKQVADLEDESTLISDGKCPKRSSLDEEA